MDDNRIYATVSEGPQQGVVAFSVGKWSIGDGVIQRNEKKRRIAALD